MQFLRSAAAFIKKESTKKYLVVLAILLAAVSLLEVFLFNFRALESAKNQPYDLLAHGDIELQGLIPTDEANTYMLAGEPEGGYAITFSGLGLEIKNLHADIELWPGEPYIYISFTDAGNALPIEPVRRSLSSEVARSTYIRIHQSGLSDILKIGFDQPQYSTVTLRSIELNAPVPFTFSFVRVFALAGILFLGYLLRPASAVYNLKLLSADKKWLKIVATAVLFLFMVVVFRAVTTRNPFWLRAERPYDSQYQRVAEALADGQLHLKDEPPEWLLEMDNPYDTRMRMALEEETGEIALWDHAFYEGRYYSYFGVLPALVYYLPYYLLTGTHAPTYFGVFLCLAAFAALSMLLIYAVVKRWFKDTPFVSYLLLSALFISVSGAVYIAHRPDFYSFPIILALALAVGGLYFWISAKKEDGNLCGIRLALGALCIALTALSRPQFLLAAFLAAPLFWDDVFKSRTLFSKKTLGRTALFLLPFLLVAAVTMWYNAARFSSPLDFGANYNLTSNDMTVRGIVPSRGLLGFFVYLLQPPAVEALFPYLTPVNTATNYVGTTIKESAFGGAFWNGGFLLLSLSVFWAKQLWGKKISAIECSAHQQLALPFGRPTGRADMRTVRRLAVTAFCFALVVIFMDTQMAGIVLRYHADFSFYLLLISVFTALTLYEKLEGTSMFALFVSLVNVVALCSFLYQFLLSYTDHHFPLSFTDTAAFERVRILFEFLG